MYIPTSLAIPSCVRLIAVQTPGNVHGARFFSPVDGGLGFSVWACDDSSGALVMHGLELPSARGRFASPDGCGQSVVASRV